MLTKPQLLYNLQFKFPYHNKIVVENLIALFSPSNQNYYGFYLRELITDNTYFLVCSFDVQINTTTQITIDFSLAPFKISRTYNLYEVVDKVHGITIKSAYIRKQIHSSSFNLDCSLPCDII